MKAGLAAAEKNRVAVVLVSMVTGPVLGVWELARYLFRSPFLLEMIPCLLAPQRWYHLCG